MKAVRAKQHHLEKCYSAMDKAVKDKLEADHQTQESSAKLGQRYASIQEHDKRLALSVIYDLKLLQKIQTKLPQSSDLLGDTNASSNKKDLDFSPRKHRFKPIPECLQSVKNALMRKYPIEAILYKKLAEAILASSKASSRSLISNIKETKTGKLKDESSSDSDDDRSPDARRKRLHSDSVAAVNQLKKAALQSKKKHLIKLKRDEIAILGLLMTEQPSYF